MVPIPALATMMSSRPSCSTPLSTAALERVVVANVDLGGDDAPVEVLDQVRGLGEVLGRRTHRRRGVEVLADVDGDDVGAFLRQPHRVAAALAARRTGDERDLALLPDQAYADAPRLLGDRPTFTLRLCLAARWRAVKRSVESRRARQALIRGDCPNHARRGLRRGDIAAGGGQGRGEARAGALLLPEHGRFVPGRAAGRRRDEPATSAGRTGRRQPPACVVATQQHPRRPTLDGVHGAGQPPKGHPQRDRRRTRTASAISRKAP